MRVVLAIAAVVASATATGEIFRCDVDGVATYSNTPCASASLPPSPPPVAVPLSAKRADACRRLSAFAAQTIDARRSGVQQQDVVQATKGTNAALLPIVATIYQANDADLDATVRTLYDQCLFQYASSAPSITPP